MDRLCPRFFTVGYMVLNGCKWLEVYFKQNLFFFWFFESVENGQVRPPPKCWTFNTFIFIFYGFHYHCENKIFGSCGVQWFLFVFCKLKMNNLIIFREPTTPSLSPETRKWRTKHFNIMKKLCEPLVCKINHFTLLDVGYLWKGL